jgi:hypothetical protein
MYIQQEVKNMINDIIKNVEQNCDVRVFIDQDDFDECAYYIPEVNAIGINHAIDEAEQVASIIHEVAHFVDISENGHDRREIDEEVIAHAVEEVVFWNAPVQGVISEVENDIRESYMFNGVVSVDENDIAEVAERVKIICNYF